MKRGTKYERLTKKFATGEYRLIQERNDFFLPQVISFIEEQTWDELIPAYQRRPVWDGKKKSRFIESLIMNIPIPPIFLFEHELGRYEIMDGQQRTSAIRDFFSGELKLTGLETWSDLNGLKYEDLPKELKQALSRRRISATVILNETIAYGSKSWGDLDLRREVFSRLNSGGVNLSAQELRNSLYSGPLNSAIIGLAALSEFTSSWGIPSYNADVKPHDLPEQVRENSMFKRMKDCEYILRFFTLREPSKLKGSIKSSMDRFMEANMEIGTQEVENLRQRFTNCVKVSKYIFGQRNFSTKDKSENWTRAVQAYDGMMLAIDSLGLEWREKNSAWKAAGDDFRERLKSQRFREEIIDRRTSFQSVKRHKDIFTGLIGEHVGQ
ncbi:MAG: DUF262 domain-containing protein [Verrucomicrobiales bacterium]